MELIQLATWRGRMDRVVMKQSTAQHLLTTANNVRLPASRRASARAKLTPPVTVPFLGYVWEWCSELMNGLQAGFSSTRASWRDLQAYAQLMQIGMTPWEARLVLSMSDAYLRAIDPPQKQKETKHERLD